MLSQHLRRIGGCDARIRRESGAYVTQMLRAKFAMCVIARVSCKCCAHLCDPSVTLTRDRTFLIGQKTLWKTKSCDRLHLRAIRWLKNIAWWMWRLVFIDAELFYLLGVQSTSRSLQHLSGSTEDSCTASPGISDAQGPVNLSAGSGGLALMTLIQCVQKNRTAMHVFPGREDEK
jgi:hypothetical protein